MTTSDENSPEPGPEPTSPEPTAPTGRRHYRGDPADAVERLVRANVASNDTMRTLVEKVRQDAHARERKIDLLEEGLRKTRHLFWLVAIAVALMIGIGIINATMIQQARRNAAITAAVARDSQATYALLLDCLNTQGECGKRNATQTKALLDEIKRYELTVIYCARTNPQPLDADGSKFVACIDRLYPGGPALNGR